MKHLSQQTKNKLKSNLQNKLDSIFGKHVYHVDRIGHPHGRKQISATITHHYPKHIVVNGHVHQIQGNTANSKCVQSLSNLKNLSVQQSKRNSASQGSHIAKHWHLRKKSLTNQRATLPVIQIVSKYHTTGGNLKHSYNGLNSDDRMIFKYNGLNPHTKPTYFCSSYNNCMHNGAIHGKYSLNEQLTARYLRSLGVSYIHGQLLHVHGIDFRKHNHRTDRHLHADFLIPKEFTQNKHDIAIEVDGTQHNKLLHIFGGLAHFSRQVKNDQKKNLYCKRHHINLYRIPMYKIHNRPYMNKLNKTVIQSPEKALSANLPITKKDTMINATLDRDLLPNLSFNKLKQSVGNNKQMEHGLNRANAKGSWVLSKDDYQHVASAFKRNFNRKLQIGKKLEANSPYISYNKKLHQLVDNPKYQEHFSPQHYSRVDADFLSKLNTPISKQVDRKNHTRAHQMDSPMSKQQISQLLNRASRGLSNTVSSSMKSANLTKSNHLGRKFNSHDRKPLNHIDFKTHHIDRRIAHHGISRE